MKKINKKILFLILFGVILVFPVVSLGQAADPVNIVCRVRDAFFKVATAIIVIGWVIAGILWLISAGSPEQTGIAKKATFAAVIGTVLVILAWGAGETIAALLGFPPPPQYCPRS